MRTLLSALLLLMAGSAVAETRFVDDKLLITLRTGQATTYQILKTLPSGTPLELLEEDGQYSRVRTEDGTEGWVLTQYLSASPIARDRLLRAERRIEQLQTQIDSLKQQLGETRGERNALAKQHKDAADDAEKLRRELNTLQETAARPIKLAQENRQLKEELKSLQQQSSLLESDNERLRDRSERDWFITGAGVLGGGILLGLVLPMLRRRKRNGMFD